MPALPMFFINRFIGKYPNWYILLLASFCGGLIFVASVFIVFPFALWYFQGGDKPLAESHFVFRYFQSDPVYAVLTILFIASSASIMYHIIWSVKFSSCFTKTENGYDYSYTRTRTSYSSNDLVAGMFILVFQFLFFLLKYIAIPFIPIIIIYDYLPRYGELWDDICTVALLLHPWLEIIIFALTRSYRKRKLKASALTTPETVETPETDNPPSSEISTPTISETSTASVPEINTQPATNLSQSAQATDETRTRGNAWL